MGYADEVLADSPLLYWRLGESVISSGAVDSSGNGRHGIYYGMTDGNLNKSGLVPTESDTACAFVDPGKVVLADAAWMDTSFTAGITVEGWFRPDTPGTGHQYLYSRYQGADNGRHLLLRITDVTGALRAAVYPNSTSGIGVDGPVVIAATTYHVVVTYDNTTLAIYVNGTLYDSVSGALGAFSSSLNLPIYLGARQYGTSPTTASQEHFDGRMDDWAVYDTALSPARIAAHYQAGTSVPLLSQGWGLRTPKRGKEASFDYQGIATSSGLPSGQMVSNLVNDAVTVHDTDYDGENVRSLWVRGKSFTIQPANVDVTVRQVILGSGVVAMNFSQYAPDELAAAVPAGVVSFYEVFPQTMSYDYLGIATSSGLGFGKMVSNTSGAALTVHDFSYEGNNLRNYWTVGQTFTIKPANITVTVASVNQTTDERVELTFSEYTPAQFAAAVPAGVIEFVAA